MYINDTDRFYIEKKPWVVLDKDKLVGVNLWHGKNDRQIGDTIYGLFKAPKVNNCLTIDKYGIFEENGILRVLQIHNDY